MRLTLTQARHRTVLVTGASGVVGRALLPRLTGHKVICLTRSTEVAQPGITTATVRGDIRAPRLGLSTEDYQAIARSVDVIVHAAAATNFTSYSRLSDTNVGGTERVVALAKETGAHLVHVSSAFFGTTATRSTTAVAYARTKAEAERIVRHSGVPATVVRPSVVVGDSRTGEIGRHQGFHDVVGAVMRGLVPLAPLEDNWLLDFVPQDVVADAIAGLLDGSRVGTDAWLTAGHSAMTIGQIAGEAVALAASLGCPVSPVRFVSPEMYDRLIAPVFLKAMGAPARTALTRLADRLSAYLTSTTPFPSDLPALPDQRTTLRMSMRRWAHVTGFGSPAADEVVA